MLKAVARHCPLLEHLELKRLKGSKGTNQPDRMAFALGHLKRLRSFRFHNTVERISIEPIIKAIAGNGQLEVNQLFINNINTSIGFLF